MKRREWFCVPTLHSLTMVQSSKKISSPILYRDARTLVRSTLPAVSISAMTRVSVVIISGGQPASRRHHDRDRRAFRSLSSRATASLAV
jgi:hypothetical protein